ncbi:hypothetical protein GOP47_0001261 [Adiantum capillus-veneris]|uniref:Uncharacterized protein n=1 Tax=Adiantum capillus-veneris TaxID=13818 RepID=A0A9D4VGR3_ADICA|nr:hypothetical protein GOP47_0001261 [Adiantum capillus-veneris]
MAKDQELPWNVMKARAYKVSFDLVKNIVDGLKENGVNIDHWPETFYFLFGKDGLPTCVVTIFIDDSIGWHVKLGVLSLKACLGLISSYKISTLGFQSMPIDVIYSRLKLLLSLIPNKEIWSCVLPPLVVEDAPRYDYNL